MTGYTNVQVDCQVLLINRSNKFVDNYKILKTASNKEIQHYLLRQAYQFR